MRLAKRILWVAFGAVVLLVWAAVAESNAASIHFGGGKIFAQPQQRISLLVAPSGGDSSSSSERPPSSPTPDKTDPLAAAHNARQSLKNAAIPDFRAVAGIILVILLLRRMQTPRRDVVSTDEPKAETTEMRRAA